MTGTLAAPLAEALDAVVRIHEAAKAMNLEHGFEIFDESAMPDALAAATLGILRSDPEVLAALAEALFRQMAQSGYQRLFTAHGDEYLRRDAEDMAPRMLDEFLGPKS